MDRGPGSVEMLCKCHGNQWVSFLSWKVSWKRSKILLYSSVGLITPLCWYLFAGVAAPSAGGSEGFSSHRESQRPQRLQEAAQDENQRPGALHQDRLETPSCPI